MTHAMDVQELGIMLVTEKHTPTMLNPDVLRCSGIVPTDWELARSPLYAQHLTQLIFQNGVSLVAEANRILFTESIKAKALPEICIAEIARNYLERLPHANYRNVVISLKGFAVMNPHPDAARQYIVTRLLAPGPWQELGQEPVRASLNFIYALEHKRLHLSVNEAILESSEGKSVPAILFSGNFEYAPTHSSSTEHHAHFGTIIEHWQADLNIFQDLVNHRFLSHEIVALAVSQPELVPLSA
jgi:hypothetical protein